MTSSSTFASPEWMRDAECTDAAPDAFFSDARNVMAIVKRVCASCPVATQCLNYAVANPELLGIWGGTTHDERRRFRTGLHKLCRDCGAKVFDRRVRCGTCTEAHAKKLHNERQNKRRAGTRGAA